MSLQFQFPTGWNSTQSITSLRRWNDAFQFPTGWNSTIAKSFCFSFAWFSFNSQRDGILRGHYVLIFAFGLEFQFPTGWNSTETLTSFPSQAISFNSQRDGILPFRTSQMQETAKFQFPTGWNSTLAKSSKFSLISSRFNSQRDGILRAYGSLCKGQPKRFQFPTGWNSTNLQRCILCPAKLFQFPTGWNSTQLFHSNTFLKKLFQFPTGWNSTLFS